MLISPHTLNKRLIFKVCTLMFKIKNSSSPAYPTDLNNSPPLKPLKSYAQSHEFTWIPITIHTPNLHFPTATPLYGTLFLLTSPPSLLFFHSVRLSKLSCLSSSQRNVPNTPSILSASSFNGLVHCLHNFHKIRKQIR